MVSTTNFKQRKEIPALSIVKKECEEILKQHAQGKVKRNSVNAKVDSCRQYDDKKNEPIEVVLDPVYPEAEVEEEPVEARLLGQ